ncbi:hypothetical protein DTL42_24375 [Bremerella cremea]|uniref:Uncharacterized protein n=2 Tax=Bremerella cremea TaxID=1031537 RepID=A0A368KIX7_9BACT|nr:hypothetical protein DTL42_24375 [Bremerella cremea]
MLVIVTMAAAVLIATLSLQRVTRQSQARRNQVKPQMALLLESAVGLAKVRLQANADYQGETWKIPAESGSLDLPAEIVIAVRPHDEQHDLKNIDIQVQLGDQTPRISRESLQLTLSLPSSEQNR